MLTQAQRGVTMTLPSKLGQGKISGRHTSLVRLNLPKSVNAPGERNLTATARARV